MKLAVELQTKFFEQDRNAYNIIAEIRGVDPKIGDEVVMAGAHLDSWHTGTGATDNADGVSTVIEALRRTASSSPLDSNAVVSAATAAGASQSTIRNRDAKRNMTFTRVSSSD